VRRNAGARAGDVLILSKPLGVGVISAALKADRLPEAAAKTAYAALVAATTQLNAVGAELARSDAVHAMTDVTGFGLLGHALEVCRGSGLAADIRFADLPLLDGVADLAQQGCRTGAALRNWASYGSDVTLAASAPEWQRDLLCDPQTSGGLLISTAPEAAGHVLAVLHAAGFAQAAVIGGLQAGPPGITIS
jgi:selenide,water dikinase